MNAPNEYTAYLIPRSSTWVTGIPIHREDGVSGIKWTDEHTNEEWFEWYEEDE